MSRFASRRPVARLIFIIGFVLLFLGSTFLIGSPPGISLVLVQIAFLFVSAGVVSAVVAVKISRRSLYIFFAGLFLQAGLFFFLAAIDAMPLGVARAWPLLSVFAGVALLPAGWHRYGAIRASYVVLAAAFIILGLVLMIFSLDMVDFSFSQFILDWWPLLVVLAGIVLVLAALGSRLTGGFRK